MYLNIGIIVMNIFLNQNILTYRYLLWYCNTIQVINIVNHIVQYWYLYCVKLFCIIICIVDIIAIFIAIFIVTYIFNYICVLLYIVFEYCLCFLYYIYCYWYCNIYIGNDNVKDCLVLYNILSYIAIDIVIFICYLAGKNVFQNCTCNVPYCTILPRIFHFFMAVCKIALALRAGAPWQQLLPCLLGRVLSPDVADLYNCSHIICKICCHFLLANAALTSYASTISLLQAWFGDGDPVGYLDGYSEGMAVARSFGILAIMRSSSLTLYPSCLRAELRLPCQLPVLHSASFAWIHCVDRFPSCASHSDDGYSCAWRPSAPLCLQHAADNICPQDARQMFMHEF